MLIIQMLSLPEVTVAVSPAQIAAKAARAANTNVNKQKYIL
jgi:hypothetical protein